MLNVSYSSWHYAYERVRQLDVLCPVLRLVECHLEQWAFDDWGAHHLDEDERGQENDGAFMFEVAARAAEIRESTATATEWRQ